MRLSKVLIFSFFIALLTLWGCSTTNHATLPTQSYQDITSHYNAYFNVHEKLKGVYKSSETFHKDKYDSVIPVYHYNDSKEFASHASDLDDVIKRSTLAVQLHTVANWTDDHFLLVGQAHYLKGDYDKAASSFKYITTEFKDGVDYVKVMKSLGKKPGKYVRKKRKNTKPEVKVITNTDGSKSLQKVDKRPEVSIWIHTPARSEALVWLIKTYTRQKKYEQASSVVTYVRNDDLFYKNYEPDLNLAEADLDVSKRDYAAAITPLEKYLDADKIKKKKRLTARPLFVLAQCYQMTGNYPKAIEDYKKVLKSRPSNEMEFYAKLKMAKIARASSNSDNEIRALLARMAKDNRYRDYWDQVYYELAMISLAENHREDARKFLHKSIAKTTSNSDQKAISFLKLAEMDYEDEAYVPSKYMYDSTLHFLAKNDKRYHDVDERDKLLTNLVKQLNIIYEEDSLQKLATLPKDQQDKAIKDAIARKQKEEEEKKRAAEEAKQQAQYQSQLNNLQAGGNKDNKDQQTQGSSWYFYNTATRASGYNDFEKKWGKRNLEEDWRRKNKTTGSESEANEINALDTMGAKKDSTPVKGTIEDQMRANIPTTTEKMAKSVDRIVDAYYTAGVIYKDGLESYPKAEEMFSTLNSRFPKHKLLLESYYNLYLIALKRKQDDIAANYKNQIITEFPESVIAKVLRDPNYVNQAKSKEKAMDEYFQSTYNDYSNNRLDSAWYKSEMSNTVFNPNPLSAKFQLLEALILAKQNRLSDYVQALNNIVSKSTDAQVKKTASDMLAMLNKSTLPQIDLSKDTLRRDSLNSAYSNIKPVFNAGKPDTTELSLLKKLDDAKALAIKKGLLKDTSGVQTNVKDTTGKGVTASKVAVDTSALPNNSGPVSEDTTSPYKRSDAAVHYFIIYIKDPATQQSAVMSTLAKINAFNSTQFPAKRLKSRQVVIDSKNRLLNIQQFKDKDEALEYFNTIKTQGQLFSDMKAGQYAITVISSPNYSTLMDQKDVDAYNRFFTRVYK